MTVTFKSAFGHSLRSSRPIPVPEHLAHFTCALLAGSYTLKVSPSTDNQLSLELILPDYTLATPAAPFIIDEGVELSEEALNNLKELSKEATPAGFLAKNSRGGLSALYQYADEQRAVLLSSDRLPAMQSASVQLRESILGELQKACEAVEGRSIFDMDELLAEAEKAIISGLSRLVYSGDAGESKDESGEKLIEYFDKIAQLHDDLVNDLTVEEDGGCCGGEGGCCGDEPDNHHGGCEDEHCHSGCGSGHCC